MCVYLRLCVSACLYACARVCVCVCVCHVPAIDLCQNKQTKQLLLFEKSRNKLNVCSKTKYLNKHVTFALNSGTRNTCLIWQQPGFKLQTLGGRVFSVTDSSSIVECPSTGR